MKLRRTQLGQSQEQLAAAIGYAFQQVQKYERGANRVSASMLHRIANALGVPVSFFFDGLPTDLAASPPAAAIDHIVILPEWRELLRQYYLIPAKLRRSARHLVRTLAGCKIAADET